MTTAILFDKDGTLIEFESTWHQIMTLTFERLKDEDIDALKALSSYTPTGFKKDSIIQYMRTSDIAEVWMPSLKHHTKAQIIDLFNTCATYHCIQYRCRTGVQATIKKLYQKGYRLGVATADTPKATEHSLRCVGLRQYFCYIGTDDGVLKAKPNIDIAVDFAQRKKVAFSDMLIVGDSISDYHFAQNVGTQFIGIKTKYSRLAECVSEDLLIDDFKELIKVLQG